MTLHPRAAQRITVIGAGTMGHGIAQVAATCEFDVTLVDVDQAVLDRALAAVRANLSRGVDKGKLTAAEADAAHSKLVTSTDLEAAVADADLTIEAVPERLALKQEVFARLSAAPAHAVLATNTSALSVTEIAAAAADPTRVVGMHFFNPPYALKLLELVRAEQTAPGVLEAAKEIAERLDRELVVVHDSPGFATSRLGLVLGLEAMRMVQEGVARPEDIDRAMTLGYRHPMGPLRLSDLIGLDVRLAIAEHLHRELGERFRPPPILRRLVRAGKLGKKTGEGFYVWET